MGAIGFGISAIPNYWVLFALLSHLCVDRGSGTIQESEEIGHQRWGGGDEGGVDIRCLVVAENTDGRLAGDGGGSNHHIPAILHAGSVVALPQLDPRSWCNSGQ